MWFLGEMAQRSGFYEKIGTKEWFLCEGWYRGVVSKRRMVRRSGFYQKDGREEWFLGF